MSEEKPTFIQLKNMIEGENPPVNDILKYIKIDISRSNPFNLRYAIDEDKVEMDGIAEYEINLSLNWWNSSAKTKRQDSFNGTISEPNHLPVLVSEGDSWFQFPCLTTGNDIIEHLNSDYLIWSMGEVGATLSSMYVSSEYLSWVKFGWRDKVKAFLLSAAGNDIIGERNGQSVLQVLLREYDPTKPPAWHIIRGALDKTLNEIEWHYRRIIESIHGIPALRELPILIHGYDYPFPYPYGKNDNRIPCIGEQDQWLGKSFESKGYPSSGRDDIRRSILILMINELYGMMMGLQRRYNNVHLVDLRNSLPTVGDWRDELHGRPKALKAVAERFQVTLKYLI